MRRSDFAYDLPEKAIAQTPLETRHNSRLLTTGELGDHRFVDLPDLLDPGDLVVVNETRVRSARLHGRKAKTGAKVEALVLRRVGPGVWEALLRPARRLRVGTVLDFGALRAEVLTTPVEGLATILLEGDDDPEILIEEVGETPLPPYINRRLPDGERYQTMFARELGSAAAPTAGLHFTKTVVTGLEERGIAIAPVELKVGIDTFRPIETEDISEHVMHRERISIPEGTATAIASTRAEGGRVVAIGTTVVRTLESRPDGCGGVVAGDEETGLFIVPGFDFKVVDVLVTNFHLPGSSLIVMVAALMGPGWKQVYEIALRRGYRFLSFGDAMLAERHQ
ncbi:MAG: tRNA preQ1(34) S-adenosylmethionine ribosyltransferase-isomerase QueA [Acidimicrobiia bacterium]|nr:tRNA preQ1(34) S-adenosylmethionine ribosyltransferase-isomerase QueA [Acidimicrobiia bacterium]